MNNYRKGKPMKLRILLYCPLDGPRKEASLYLTQGWDFLPYESLKVQFHIDGKVEISVDYVLYLLQLMCQDFG
jgi:hypothetical protein